MSFCSGITHGSTCWLIHIHKKRKQPTRNDFILFEETWFLNHVCLKPRQTVPSSNYLDNIFWHTSTTMKQTQILIFRVYNLWWIKQQALTMNENGKSPIRLAYDGFSKSPRDSKSRISGVHKSKIPKIQKTKSRKYKSLNIQNSKNLTSPKWTPFSKLGQVFVNAQV